MGGVLVGEALGEPEPAEGGVGSGAGAVVDGSAASEVIGRERQVAGGLRHPTQRTLGGAERDR